MAELAPIAKGWISTTGETGAQNYDEFADDAEITGIVEANPHSMLAVEMAHCTPEMLAEGADRERSLRYGAERRDLGRRAKPRRPDHPQRGRLPGEGRLLRRRDPRPPPPSERGHARCAGRGRRRTPSRRGGRALTDAHGHGPRPEGERAPHPRRLRPGQARPAARLPRGQGASRRGRQPPQPRLRARGPRRLLRG